mgnify:CR=1 FL=1
MSRTAAITATIAVPKIRKSGALPMAGDIHSVIILGSSFHIELRQPSKKVTAKEYKIDKTKPENQILFRFV